MTNEANMRKAEYKIGFKKEAGEFLRTVYNENLKIEFALIDNGDRVRWIPLNSVKFI